MTRKFLIMVFVLCALALVGCNTNNSARKFAVVDAEKVFQESKLAARAMDYLEQKNQAMNTRIMDMQNELTAKPEDKELGTRLQAEFSSLQQQFELDRMTAADKVKVVFDKALADCLKENGMDVVLASQAVLANAPGTDITDKVIALMDKENIDFNAAPAAAQTSTPAGQAQEAPATGTGAPAAPASGADAPAQPEGGAATK